MENDIENANVGWWHRFLENTTLFNKSDKNAHHVTTKQSLRFLFGGFRILGINMPANNKILYIFYSFILNMLVTVWLPLSFILSYTQMTGKDLEMSSLLTSIQVAINVIGCSVKIVIMAFLIQKLRLVEPIVEKLDARCKDEDELNVLRILRDQGRKFVILFTMAYWSYSTSTFLSSVLMDRPPYSLFMPYIHWRRTRWEFFVASFIEFILMDVACFQQVVDDSYAVIYVCILRAHIKIILLRIQKLATNSNLTKDENISELKLCIKDHKNLLELFNTIAPVISVTIFIQFMITALILGTTLINIFIFSTAVATRVASCFYILAVVVEIFPLCYYSQRLSDDSNLLSQQLFHSNWIDQDIRYKKIIIFFIQHTQQAMALTAGKLFPITLNSFLSIAKFSFTLYTFIQKMGIKERFG